MIRRIEVLNFFPLSFEVKYTDKKSQFFTILDTLIKSLWFIV